MKKVIGVVCLFFLFLSFSPAVFAQDKLLDTGAKPVDNYGVYVGLVGGYSIPGADTKAVWTAPNGNVIDFDTKLKNGFLYGFKAGWLTPFTNRILAVEFEYNHLESSYDRANLAYIYEGLDGEMRGKISLNLLMLNLLARKPGGKFHPYAGFGLGYADVKVDDLTFLNTSLFSPLTFTGGSSGVLAYQAMVGVDFDVYKNISVGIGYKYIGTTRKIAYDSIYVSGTKGNMEVDYRSHNLVLSVAYMF